MPQPWQMPPAPDWSRGTCSKVPSRMRSWWSSEIRSEREAAQLACAGCEILEQCTQWSLSLPLDDGSVWGGMDPAERRRRARALRDEIIRQVTTGRPGRKPPPETTPA
jgi:Transcription factor WhiB